MDFATLRAAFSFPTAIRFGAGAFSQLPAACRALAISRPLIVTDRGLAAAGFIADAAGLLGGAPVFAEVKGNPDDANVAAGAAAARQGGHDGIVAIGGGSAIDAAKAIAAASRHPGSLWDFDFAGSAWKKIEGAGILPLVAVPTTAGTGSEVGRGAVIIDRARAVKVVLLHARMLPGQVILDPRLTCGLPPGLTAWTGLDALAHCLEAYCVDAFHPMADGIAAEGARLIKEFLPRAVADGSDLAARGHLLVAASMGATAFQKGLGGVHALAHPIGARHDVHHGLTNAVLMPYVLIHNRPAIEERIGRLAAYLGLAPGFPAFLDWLLGLRAALGIPHDLAGLGLAGADLELLARDAAADASAATNPLPLDAASLRGILAAALEGNLR